MTGHKLKVDQIPTNTPQKELHHMDLQETIVLGVLGTQETLCYLVAGLFREIIFILRLPRIDKP